MGAKDHEDEDSGEISWKLQSQAALKRDTESMGL
jgi:hypothetical protein